MVIKINNHYISMLLILFAFVNQKRRVLLKFLKILQQVIWTESLNIPEFWGEGIREGKGHVTSIFVLV